MILTPKTVNIDWCFSYKPKLKFIIYCIKNDGKGYLMFFL